MIKKKKNPENKKMDLFHYQADIWKMLKLFVIEETKNQMTYLTKL